MTCEHPDPKTVRSLFCRTCGYYVEGVRIADATDEVLREYLTLSFPPGTPVKLISGERDVS